MKRGSRFLAAALVGLVLLTSMVLPVPISKTVEAASIEAPLPADVAGLPCEGAVRSLVSLNVFKGLPDGTFQPTKSITRAEFAATMARALDLDLVAKSLNGPSGFSDVPASHWASGYINFAAGRGLVNGVGDGKFAPGDPVTFVQVATMLIRLVGRDSDIKVPWPAGPYLTADDLGIPKGIRYDTNAPATRGDVAIMLANTIFGVNLASSGAPLAKTVFGIQKLSLSPSPAVIGGAGSVTLTAKGVKDNKEEITLGPTYTVTSGQATVTSGGKVTPTGAGAVKVRATLGSFSSEADIVVSSSFRIDPASPVALPGAAIQLTAYATGPGITENVVLPVTWTKVSGQSTLTPGGLVTVAAGDTVIQASYAGTTKTVTVRGSATLAVTPSEVSLLPGAQQQFQAAIVAEGGTPVPAYAVEWSASGGTITSGGLFTAAAGTGSVTVTARASGLSGTGKAYVLSRVEVTPGAPNLGLGEPVQFTAVGYDSAGRIMTINPTWDVTPSTLGVISSTGRMVGTVAGAGTVRATAAGISGSTSFTTAGAAAQLDIATDKSTVPANGSSEVQVTVRVLDSLGYLVKAGAYRVYFSLNSSPLGSFTANAVDTVNGVAVTTFKPTTSAGNAQIIASSTGLTTDSIFVSTTVPSASSVALSVSPAPIAASANSVTTLTATLKDQTGAVMSNNTGTTIVVTVNSSDTNVVTVPSVISIIPGASTGTTTLRSTGIPGSVSLSGSTNLSGVGLVGTTLQVAQAGAAHHLAVRGPIDSVAADNLTERSVVVELRDANEVVLTGDSSTVVSLTVSSGTATVASGTSITCQGGLATFRLRSAVAGTVSLLASSGNVTSATGSLTFTPGTATNVGLAVEPLNNIAADGGASSATLVATIRDAQGNTVTSATNAVTFSRTAGPGALTLPSTTTVTAVAGVARLTLPSGTVPGTDSFKATSTGLADSPTVTVTTRITGVPVAVQVQPIAGFAAGGSATVKVYVNDTFGQLVTSDNGRAVTLLTTGGQVTTANPTQTVNGVATFTITATAAGSLTVTASANAITADTTGATISVAPATASSMKLVASPSNVALDPNSRVAVTSYLVDSYGNNAGAGSAITLSVSPAGLGTLSNATLYPGQTVYYTPGAIPGNVTISGTSASYPVASATVATYVAGPPARAVVSATTATKAGPLSGDTIMTIKVRLEDASGNLLTGKSTGDLLSAVGLTVSGNSSGTPRISTGTVYGLGSFVPDGITRGSAGFVAGEATFQYSNTKAETVTLTPSAYYNGQALTAVAASATTTPGTPVRIAFTPARPAVRPDTASTTIVTASIADVYDNPVTSATDSIRFALSTTAYSSLSTNVAIPVANGQASVSVTGKASPGAATLTATSSTYGFSASTTATTDYLPGQPTVVATDNSGSDTIVGSGEVAAKLVITCPSRVLNQDLLVTVNGGGVTVYSTAGGSTPVTTIPGGSTGITVYINRADLGVAGDKSIMVLLTSDIGVGTMSTPVTVTLQN